MQDAESYMIGQNQYPLKRHRDAVTVVQLGLFDLERYALKIAPGDVQLIGIDEDRREEVEALLKGKSRAELAVLNMGRQADPQEVERTADELGFASGAHMHMVAATQQLPALTQEMRVVALEARYYTGEDDTDSVTVYGMPGQENEPTLLARDTVWGPEYWFLLVRQPQVSPRGFRAA